ncbi:kynureninase [Pneumocystis murina B123]|uniref:Kynureninase n=1 Tax=Pneumocystis murina (strain B123) TaxID=1069680 RepID=M7NU21_PNEMU|nr:kynureninase [Pneumocystis murina B123]EMR10757.1 kynureninase [Pneumocystis murina B123]
MDYEKVAIQNGFLSAITREFSNYLDEQDSLKELRNEFELPIQKNKADKLCIYMSGNSLGLLSKRIRVLINEELNVWAKQGVNGHFEHFYGREWVRIEETVREGLAKIVGGKKIEVVAMNSLSVNIHLLMASFYKPQGFKRKILIEDHAFSSDYYAIASHLSWHGLNPETEILTVSPLKGCYTLTTEHILQTIDKHANEIAMIFFSGVHYYTGQAFDISTITKYAKSKSIIVGWDLAHAVGNIELKLHDWKVDFAVWCTYKYLNSGPGGVGGIFVHEYYANNRLRLLGWWGNDLKTRFNMNNQQFDSLYGASGFQISNPSVFNMVSLLGSLEVFSKVSMSSIRRKSVLLTGYLEYLLLTLCSSALFTIITPGNPEERGAQLSLRFYKDSTQVIFDQLRANGVVVDLRKPDVIRVAPVPLYNTFGEVFDFVCILKKILDSLTT